MLTNLKLFFTFLKLGFISFGGGYAMLPLIEHQAQNNGWLEMGEFAKIMTIAGVSSGSIAENSVILVGYNVNDISGAVFAGLGMVLPAFTLAVVLGSMLYRIKDNDYIKSVFYILKPIIVSLILYAAFKFAVMNKILSLSNMELKNIFIITASFIMVVYFKIHPAVIFLTASIVGIIIF
jgi:chromate transporter